MPDTESGRERLAVIEEKLKENTREHSEIKECIAEVKKETVQISVSLADLKTNHVVFKTRVLAYWAVGVAVLTAVLQILLNYLGKHL